MYFTLPRNVLQKLENMIKKKSYSIHGTSNFKCNSFQISRLSNFYKSYLMAQCEIHGQVLGTI